MNWVDAPAIFVSTHAPEPPPRHFFFSEPCRRPARRLHPPRRTAPAVPCRRHACRSVRLPWFNRCRCLRPRTGAGPQAARPSGRRRDPAPDFPGPREFRPRQARRQKRRVHQPGRRTLRPRPWQEPASSRSGITRRPARGARHRALPSLHGHRRRRGTDRHDPRRPRRAGQTKVAALHVPRRTPRRTFPRRA